MGFLASGYKQLQTISFLTKGGKCLFSIGYLFSANTFKNFKLQTLLPLPLSCVGPVRVY